jgi:lipoprotein-releasing system ATP-binding protein
MKGSLVIDQVQKIYEVESQKVEALRGIDLILPQGTLCALIGKSGAGKSTLLHIMGTLDRPTHGKIYLGGEDLSGLSDRQASAFRNQSIGFVFQMNNLLPEFSALENVMMPGLIAGKPSFVVKARAREMLASVELSHREHHRPSELSGGEQQRVAIARAIFMAPPLLLADEPTGNLDQRTSAAIEELLFGLCQKHSMTMVLVTHDLELAKRLPHRIVMEDGKIIDRGVL